MNPLATRIGNNRNPNIVSRHSTVLLRLQAPKQSFARRGRRTLIRPHKNFIWRHRSLQKLILWNYLVKNYKIKSNYCCRNELTRNTFPNFFLIICKCPAKLWLMTDKESALPDWIIISFRQIKIKIWPTSAIRKKKPHENICFFNVCGKAKGAFCFTYGEVFWSLMVQSRYNSQYLFNDVTKRRVILCVSFTLVVLGPLK